MPPTGADVPDTREVEFKLRSRAPIDGGAVERVLRELGIDARPSESAVHVDLYLDDARRSLVRRGIGLRLRRRAGDAILCVKQRGTVRGALHVRSELEAPWPAEPPDSAPGDQPPQRALELPERLRDAVEPFVLDRRLETLAMLEVRRELRDLRRDGVLLGELAIDIVTARARDRTTVFAELEIEVRDDLPACERIARRLLEAEPLLAASEDKLAWSLHTLGLMPPPLAPNRPSHPTSLGDALSAAMQDLTARLLTAEAAARVRGGVEDIHELRVCLRRLRVLVRAFRAAWPASEAARADLALTNLGRELSGLRDRDVLCARLPRALEHLPPALRAGGDDLRALLQSNRDALVQRARESLRSPAHREDLARLESMGQRASMLHDVAGQPAAALARVLRRAVRACRDDLRSLDQDTPQDQVHRARLRLKRLRILLEELTPRRKRGRARRRLVRAIDRLGIACDHDAAGRHHLALLHQTAPTELPPRLAALLGALVTWHRDGLVAARAAALRATQRLDRRRIWRSLRDPQA
ncbi:MAG: CHAD domain-containing protein [Planctomycetota bacterium]